MAVPSWTVDDAVAALNLVAHDDVLEDFVYGVADVQRPIGVWWAIVEDKRAIGWSVRRLPGIQVVGALP